MLGRFFPTGRALWTALSLGSDSCAVWLTFLFAVCWKCYLLFPFIPLSTMIINHRSNIMQSSQQQFPWKPLLGGLWAAVQIYRKKLLFIWTDQIWGGNGLYLLIQIQKYELLRLYCCIFRLYVCRKESESYVQVQNLEVTLCWLPAGTRVNSSCFLTG